jgi:pilus assembly protein CpaB
VENQEDERGVEMLKNRTIIGIICIIAAMGVTFGISPLVSRAFEGKKSVVVLKRDVPQGAEITAGDVTLTGRGTYGLPAGVYTDIGGVVGKYATAKLFAGTAVLPGMISETLDDSDSMLRSLGENETAMSLPIKQYSDGLSGKLLSGDIVKIVGYDAENKRSVIFPELRYIEVLTATTDGGADNINSLSEKENGDLDKPVTVTLKLRSDLQALRLADCVKNGIAQVVFVSRNPDRKAVFLGKQAEILEEIEKENALPENDVSGAGNALPKPIENAENPAAQTAENAIADAENAVAQTSQNTEAQNGSA